MSPRMGRPPLPDGAHRVARTVRMPVAAWDALDALCVASGGSSRGEVVEALVEVATEREKAPR